ncbi:MAG: ABC transporter substrate-binding protein [Thermomicrobiales bacterium]|nr:ABC transporter substrate-binding protein [Thermomicrobiales bacterium]
MKTETQPDSERLSRRSVVRGGLLLTLGAGVGFAARGHSPAVAASPATPQASPVAGWSFTDDRGVTVTLPEMPTRVLAQVNAAASLWDFGVRPVGIWGPARTSRGEPHSNAGRIDLDTVTSVTEGWSEPDLERFLALDPDLIVSTVWAPDDPVLWGIYPEEVQTQVDAIAPSAAILVAGVTLDTLIGRFGDLAAALGADLATPELDRARADFAAAQERLAAAIAAKPGLRVLFCGAYDEALWTSSDTTRPDLRLFADLGMTIVTVAEGEPYSDVSWEQVGRLPADLVVFDARVDTGYPSLAETIEKAPTLAQHPAVVAGQTAGWQYEYVMSYQGATEMLNELAAAIEAADVLTEAFPADGDVD